MPLTQYPFQDNPICQKCGGGAQRGGPGSKGWDSVTQSVHMVCWACKYEYLMSPADARPIITKLPSSTKKAWWRL